MRFAVMATLTTAFVIATVVGVALLSALQHAL